MRHSESLAQIGPALTAAQAEMENAIANATNPAFKRAGSPSKYADLSEVLDVVKPVLNKHGISVVQFPGFEAGAVMLETVLLHESGEWIAGTAGAPLPKADPQGAGSAITYLRRYSLAAVAGITQEDDDGRAASRHTNGNGRKAEPRITDEQGRQLVDLIEATNTDVRKMLAHYGISAIAELPAAKFADAVSHLEIKLETAA